MVKTNGALIREVFSGSIGDELELEPGDRIISINGQKLTDFIDFLTLSAESELTLEILKKSGEYEEIEFSKDPDEPLGLTFEDNIYDRVEECVNHCLFCFVHQLPQGQRATLYVQDDDYRLSFLQGCYITLTNLSETDWKRIEDLNLSPLYISVHATEPLVRQKLLGSKKAGPILEQLNRLAKAGITVHTQAVICPGINDGAILEKTIQDLAEQWPAVASLAIVPVGLTEHRNKLFPLRKFNPKEARDVIDTVHRFQQLFQDRLDTRFVFAADEWYLQAETAIPDEETYEDYPQLDNGVGLIRWFLSDFEESFREFLNALQPITCHYTVLTGQSALGLWQTISEIFQNEAPGIQIEVIPVINQFFGKTVTVTGLLSGHDLVREINNVSETEATVFLIPRITLKQGEDVFLDGLTLEELIKNCSPRKIAIVPTRASDWLEWIIKEGCVFS